MADDPLRVRLRELEAEIARLECVNEVLMNRVERSTDAAGSAYSIYLDFVYKWDASTEEALGVDLVGEGAVLWCQGVVDANTGVHTLAFLAENTDYFVAWRSGNDSLVIVTDQSTKSGLCVVAYN